MLCWCNKKCVTATIVILVLIGIGMFATGLYLNTHQSEWSSYWFVYDSTDGDNCLYTHLEYHCIMDCHNILTAEFWYNSHTGRCSEYLPRQLKYDLLSVFGLIIAFVPCCVLWCCTKFELCN